MRWILTTLKQKACHENHTAQKINGIWRLWSETYFTHKARANSIFCVMCISACANGILHFGTPLMEHSASCGCPFLTSGLHYSLQKSSYARKACVIYSFLKLIWLKAGVMHNFSYRPVPSCRNVLWIFTFCAHFTLCIDPYCIFPFP
jgi:hypothetical protein